MDEDKVGKNLEDNDSNHLDLNQQTLAGSTSNVRHTSSSPIEIKQSQGSKFGVIHARYPPESGCLTDKNGEPVPIDKIIRTANTMSNIMMAHKIALEDDFRLEPGMDIKGPLMSLSPIIGSSPSGTNQTNNNHTEPSLQSRVKNIVHEAYWDLFKEELESQSKENNIEKKYEMSKQLLTDISQKIIELLLPQHSRLKQDIEDRLDPKIIDQLIRADTLDLADYARYILDLLSKLCAPVRDDKLRELKETTDIVQVYRGIMELLELMRLDFANFTLNRFKPHIKAHSQEYEREKFNEVLKHQKSIGIDGLEYTKIWLERAVRKVDAIYGLAEIINETSSMNNEDLNSTSVTPPNTSSKESSCGSPMSIEEKILKSDVVIKSLNVAYCELLEWTPTTQKLYPETLLFDEATFKLLSEQYKVLLLTSSILLTAFAFITKFKLQDDQEFRMLIKSHVITLLTASYDNQTQPSGSATTNVMQKSLNIEEQFDSIKLDTISERLCDDIRQKLNEVNPNQIESFLSQKELLKRQISDLQNSSNRVRELAGRRITEFVETLLMLDVDHRRKKFSSKHVPPVTIPLGLNCLADEITLTMAQLVKLVRYNRTVFFPHYQKAIVDIVKDIL